MKNLKTIIAHVQITINRVHRSKAFKLLNHYFLMYKHRRNAKNRSQKRTLVPSKQPEPDFLQTCRFRKVLHIIELSSNVKMQKILMTGSKNMGKKSSKMPPKWGSLPFVTS